MSIVTYNGVTFPYAMHTSFRQEAVYDDSQTDWHLTKFDIEISALVCASYLSALDPSLPAGSNPAAIMNQIYMKLMRPRQPLSITFNGVQLIPDNHMTGSVDARNGPQPQHCSILELNNTTFIISWRVIAHYFNGTTGPSDAALTNPILYNRWSETADIDNLGMTKRTRTGKFVMRSDNTGGAGSTGGKLVDQLRPIGAVLGIPEGFVRASANYTVDPNGLGLAYTIVDQEVYKLPPQPAYEATGSYTESTGRAGVRRYCEVELTLKGAKTTNQTNLIQAAVSIANSKLVINGASTTSTNPSKRAIIESASLSVGMWENWVKYRIRVQANPRSRSSQGKGRLYGVAGIDDAGLTFTPSGPFGSPVTPPMPIYGSAGRLLVAAAYYDPSIDVTMNPATGQITPGVEVGKAGGVPDA